MKIEIMIFDTVYYQKKFKQLHLLNFVSLEHEKNKFSPLCIHHINSNNRTNNETLNVEVNKSFAISYMFSLLNTTNI